MADRITDYKLIQSTGPLWFEREIRKAGKDGWLPQGGVHSYINDTGSRVYVQAMVKYANDD